jgi:hypothetical protein
MTKELRYLFADLKAVEEEAELYETIAARIFRYDPCSESHDSIDSLNALPYNHEVVAGKTGAGGR